MSILFIFLDNVTKPLAMHHYSPNGHAQVSTLSQNYTHKNFLGLLALLKSGEYLRNRHKY